ncbi:MAG: immunoglobulin domain-containing protein [Planctomycetota bacterium]
MHGLRTLLALLFVVSGGSHLAHAQPNSDYVLMIDQECTLGSVVLTKVSMDNFGQTVSGWSFGVCHDEAVLNLVDVINGLTTATVNGGSPPAFNGVNQSPNPGGGYTVGAVVDLSNSFFLPTGVGFDLYSGVYEFLAPPTASTSTPIDFCDTIGTPPVSILITLTTIVGVEPVRFGDVVVPLGCFCTELGSYTGLSVSFEEVAPGPVGVASQSVFLGLGVDVVPVSGGVEVVVQGGDLTAVSPTQLLANPNGLDPNPGLAELDFVLPTTGENASVTQASLVLVSAGTGTATVTAFAGNNQVAFSDTVTGTPGARTLVEIFAPDIDRIEVTLDSGAQRFGVDDLCFDQPVVVLDPPVIDTDPVGGSVCEGGTFSFDVMASSPLALSYQWLLDGGPIAGANGTSYSIATVSLADGGSYTCDVTNSDGTTSTAAAVLTVLPLPTITTAPQPSLACPGDNTTLSVVATGNNLTYQWQLDGSDIAGATQADLILTSVSAADVGSYAVTVTSDGCSLTTAAASLTLLSPVQITGQPGGADLCVGDSFALSVAALGSPTLTYQWRLDGNGIAGATNATYDIPAAVIGDAGSYDVIVSNGCGSETSASALVNVVSRPTITMDPTTQIACTGGNVTLTVATDPNSGVAYQWLLDGNPVPGATSSSLTINGVTALDSGNYSVVASIGACVTTSADAMLTVIDPVAITTQPSGSDLCVGDMLTLSVVTSGDEPVDYQWRLDGSDLAGATSATYSVASAQLLDAGSYDCVISNPCSAVTTTAVGVTVTEFPTLITDLQDVDGCIGASVTLAVTTAPGPVTFQWFLDGAAIAGATAATYDLASAIAADAGVYRVDVTAGTCTTSSANATLTLLDPIAIDTQPLSADLCIGDDTTLSVTASGSSPIAYQWRLNGSDLPGATAATFDLTNAQLGDAGNYDCVVTNDCGSVNSDAAMVTVTATPTILSTPSMIDGCVGAPVSLTVDSDPNTGVTYQWYLDGAPISGATAATYDIASAAATDAGDYTVDVTAGTCTATGTIGTLTINDPVTISQQPVTSSLCTGDALDLSVVASGTAPLSYQWRLDGNDISGATAATYSVAAAQASDSGSYDCVVSNTCGSQVSDAATVAVVGLPTITTDLQDLEGCLGQSVTLEVVASPATGLDYQWFLDGNAIAGATASSYVIAAAVAGDAGVYHVEVSAGSCTVSSMAATLTLLMPVSIDTQPIGADLCDGDAFSLSVAATGSATLSYQWRLDGSDIAGATAATYSVMPAQPADAGSYDCVVTNGCGSVPSDAVTVAVTAFPVITGDLLDIEACTGDMVTLEVTTTPASGLTYQWFLDGAAISGANGASYVIAAAASVDAGLYRVDISAGSCTVSSADATLTILDPVAITTQPLGADVCEGAPIALSVTASGSAALTYQWRLDGSDVAGATSPTYEVAATQLSDAGSYDCVVTNNCGSVTSDAASVAVTAFPLITTDPQDFAGCVGDSITLDVVATPASGVTYQWFLDGAPIAGATGTSYAISAAVSADAGVYRVEISAGNCVTTSADATVSLETPVTIDTQPIGANLCVGDPLDLTVSASGSGVLTYQWRLDGSDIAGATSASYSVASTQLADGGSYDCVVGNSCGTVPSDAVAVSVTVVPTITTQPQSQNGCTGTAITLTVVSDPATGVDYQWFLDGNVISGANAATYDLPAPVAADAGDYTVQVSAGSCSVLSSTATLTFDEPVTITLDPIDTGVCVGDSFTLMVAASGTMPLSFQWRRDGIDILSATSTSLTVANAQLLDAGNYDVVVTNPCGAVTSAVAVVTVGNTPVITQQPQATQGCFGLSVSLSVVSDPAVGVTYQWFLDGNAIPGANAASYDIAAAMASDAGTYSVEVALGTCNVLSGTAVLTLINPVAIQTQPTGADLCVGDALNLSVTATGDAPLTYQWRLDGNDLAGATTASFAIATVALGDAGNYDVVVTNPCGSVTSATAAVSVTDQPVITTNPTSQAGCTGDTIVLQVVTTPAAGVYQWFLDGIALAGATSDTYTIASATLADAGDYTVTAGVATCSATSMPATVSIVEAVSITVDPVGSDLCSGDPLSLSVTATGAGTLMYQWRLDGNDIVGATSATYSVAAAVPADSGDYDVVVMNGCSIAISATATVSVVDFPTITAQPQPQDGCVGDMVTFSVTATGSALTYQWHKDGADLSGETAASLTITVDAAAAGIYGCRVAAGSCSVESATAALTLLDPVVITAQPVGDTICEGFAFDLSVSATGSAPLTYQWALNGAPLAGETAATLSIAATTLADAGDYSVTVQNGCGMVVSDVATLVVTVAADCDCNGNLVLDVDEINSGAALDCNSNGIPDSCDIANGTSLDADGDGIPDECQVQQFMRGDCIEDGTIDITDATLGLDYLFQQNTPPVLECLDACDANDDEQYDLSDPIYLLFALFLNTHPIPEPFAVCGPDPTGNGTLGCNVYNTCP